MHFGRTADGNGALTGGGGTITAFFWPAFLCIVLTVHNKYLTDIIVKNSARARWLRLA